MYTMFETSGDLLNLTLAISIGVFTVFLCWLLFVVTQSIRRILTILDQAKRLIDAITDKVNRVEKIFNIVEEKMKSFSSMLPLIMTGVNKVVDILRDRKEKKRSSRSRAQKNDKD